ncbi:cytochrome o ubiquinol oxidase subunit I, partial [Candidatus Aerophobetes bacterium]
MLGRLTLAAFKHDWIEYLAGVGMFIGLVVVVIVISRHKRWTWLWREWITSVDHKKIGIMYIIVSAVMLIKGLVDAAMMRGQQAFACGDSF